jgi:hypothetical protein
LVFCLTFTEKGNTRGKIKTDVARPFPAEKVKEKRLWQYSVLCFGGNEL